MKKFISIALIFLLLIPFYGCSSKKSSHSGKYEYYGKDTQEYFGNGRFAVYVPINDQFYYLFDRRKNKSIDSIEKYSDVSPFLYTIGKKGYTKINYELGLYHQSSSLDKFDENDQEIFKLLENSSEKIPYKDSHNKLEQHNDQKGPLIYLDDDGLFVIYEKDETTFDNTYQLFDRKNNNLIDYIIKYKIYNSCNYTKIDLSNAGNTFNQSITLDDFSNEDQIVFKVLASEESTLKY